MMCSRRLRRTSYVTSLPPQLQRCSPCGAPHTDAGGEFEVVRFGWGWAGVSAIAQALRQKEVVRVVLLPIHCGDELLQIDDDAVQGPLYCGQPVAAIALSFW